MSAERKNYCLMHLLNTKVIAPMLRERLKAYFITHSFATFEEFLNDSTNLNVLFGLFGKGYICNNMSTHGKQSIFKKKDLTAYQWNMLYKISTSKQCGQNNQCTCRYEANHVTEDDLDTALVSVILLNCCQLQNCEISTVKALRGLKKSSFMHALTENSKLEFNEEWIKLISHIRSFNSSYIEKAESLKEQPFDETLLRKCNAELQSELTELKNELTILKSIMPKAWTISEPEVTEIKKTDFKRKWNDRCEPEFDVHYSPLDIEAYAVGTSQANEDIYVCGRCRTSFSHLEYFMKHKSQCSENMKVKYNYKKSIAAKINVRVEDARYSRLKMVECIESDASLSTNEPIAFGELSRKGASLQPIAFDDLSRKGDLNALKCITDKDTHIFKDFGSTSRYYDGYFVECITPNHSRNIEEAKTAKPISFEQLLNAKDLPEYTILASINTHIRPGTSLPTALSETLILCAIRRNNSMLCRLCLSLNKHLNVSIPMYLHALDLAMETSEKDSAKAIAWFITRLFVRCHLHSFESIRDIWPAFICDCCKENSDKIKIFCSKKMCIVIESTSENFSIPIVPSKFNSVEIKLLPHKHNDYNEAKCITNRIRHISNISISKEMSISGEAAENLFKNHSKLTIICNSLCKSKGYGKSKSHEIFQTPVIQLYCRAKGLIPIGEDHFPRNLCGIETDILEGHSSLIANNIHIGDMVGSKDKVGTLGGFVMVRGDRAFLTCCHVITDVESLVPGSILFDDYNPVLVKCYPSLTAEGGYDLHNLPTPFLCGRIRETPAFETDDCYRVSIDAVLVTIADDVEIDMTNLLAKTNIGLKSKYLNENCIDFNEICYGTPATKVTALSVGAISGKYNPNTEISLTKGVEKSIDLVPFETIYNKVIDEYKQNLVAWINEILFDFENDMQTDIDKFIEQRCSKSVSCDVKKQITNVVRYVVDRQLDPCNSEKDISKLLDEAVEAARNNQMSSIFGGTHIQAYFLAKASELKDNLRLARRMYNQLYITEIPFQSGDSGTCIYVLNPKKGCVGMAIADHPGGGCIATPILEIMKHFKIGVRH